MILAKARVTASRERPAYFTSSRHLPEEGKSMPEASPKYSWATFAFDSRYREANASLSRSLQKE
jgi:hypothetical protein